MKKKKRPTPRAPSGMRVMSLDQHDRVSNQLRHPLKRSNALALQSWTHDRLPDMLWAALATTALDRATYLEVFRKITDRAALVPDHKLFELTHTEFSALSEKQFDELLAPLLNHKIVVAALQTLLIYEELPDRAHWKRALPDPGDKIDMEPLMKAISHCFDHQSEQSTDCRWIKMRAGIISGRTRYPTELHEHMLSIVDYPNRGDFAEIGGRIRAGEVAFSTAPFAAKSTWPEKFWEESWKKTECIFPEMETPAPTEPPESLVRQIYDASFDVAEHFNATRKNTNLDARHDGCFGLVLFTLNLALETIGRRNDECLVGRQIIRTLAETFIVLAYLLTEDRDQLWLSYRNYGTGQAKLTLLKFLEGVETPSFIDLKTLEKYANEDIWQEFLDIDLKGWSNISVREMSIKAKAKDIYDKYYVWSSAFVHGYWHAARDTVFMTCLNPMHRFHRIPKPIRLQSISVETDIVKLCNLHLEKLNQAYPGIKTRIRLDK